MLVRSWLRKHWLVVAIVAAVAATWSWIFVIDVAKLSESAAVAYSIITFVFFVNVAITMLIFSWAIEYLSKKLKRPNALSVLVVVAIWALAEWAASYATALFWMGPGGSADSLFPFASLAPAAMWTPLKYLARFVGYHGLSAVVVGGIAALAIPKLRRFAVPYWTAVIALTVLSWALYKGANGQNVTTLVAAETLGTKDTVRAENADLVIMPEYGLDDINETNLAERIGSPRDTPFVGSKQVPTDSGLQNILVHGSTQSGFQSRQEKARLIPGGEHLAYGADMLLRVFAQDVYTDFQVRRAVAKGSRPLHVYRVGDGLVLGSAVCSSIINPPDYRKFARGGATLLTNSASLEIFKGSRIFAWEHYSLAKFMALANARPFVQAANNGTAFALDHNGKQLAEIEPVNYATVNIVTNSKTTPYTIFGEWVAILGLGVVVFGYVRTGILKKQKARGD